MDTTKLQPPKETIVSFLFNETPLFIQCTLPHFIYFSYTLLYKKTQIINIENTAEISLLSTKKADG